MLFFLNKKYILKCEKLNINKVIIIASASKIFIIIRPYKTQHEDFAHVLNCTFQLRRVKGFNLLNFKKETRKIS